MKKIILALALVAFATPALAQSPAKPAAKQPLTAASAQQNPIALLQQFSVSDLQAALADANAQTPPDVTSAQCYSALITIVQSPITNPLPAGPGVFQALQKARDAKANLASLLSPTGPLQNLNIACAPLVMSVNNTLLALGVTTGLVVGTGGLAVPALPGLAGILALLPLK